MPRVSWALHHDRPSVEIALTLAAQGQQLGTRRLLADTGAGTENAPFQLLLAHSDCLACGGKPVGGVMLRRAYRGHHPLYLIRVQIPALGFDQDLPAVGILAPPSGFDGVACFPFLNRFTYGNFGNAGEFGLEC